MRKLIIVLLILMMGCKTAKVVEGDYAFYIKDWKCDKDNNLLLKLQSVSSYTTFWVAEIKEDGKHKKCGECD